jgi:DNA-nicking Smr family endonuclease
MRRLSSDETELWRRVVRDVAPLPRRDAARKPIRKRLAQMPGPRTPAGVREAAKFGPAAEAAIIAVEKLEKDFGAGLAGIDALRMLEAVQRPAPAPHYFAGLDRASAERLKRGRYPVEGRLDLHGMTQAEAHRALAGFVRISQTIGRRCVLVITGHGRASGGVLKTAVPRWLAEPDLRAGILAIAAAQPRDGGSGALYLLLRRVRD